MVEPIAIAFAISRDLKALLTPLVFVFGTDRNCFCYLSRHTGEANRNRHILVGGPSL
jgi:hypothetical protein